ncbi:hypothetical protein HNQ57_000834 [Zhongshania antarctica]|uniref:Apea-like HEPN domain-containing protein n=1 Tax=Zhongshania antarctica TaxID=641702 RepID=A0A840R1U4_9GAMM|nr:hypothetical protein [Zhongshania antarctica]MBB5186573.1 hypothetical protein [Zhongshania antarctica]
MSRAVTADHVLFDECIDSFRMQRADYRPFIPGESYSFLLTPFELTDEWDLGICKVSSSITVGLPGAYSAFISKVKNPDWVDNHNSHLFGIALATIVSAISLKLCKSTRDDYLCRRDDLSSDDINQLAILYPVLVAGPGATNPRIPKVKQDMMRAEVENIINILRSLEYKTYRSVMQSFRLIHLSLLAKRDDFGLAYLLAVSSIESIAQKAIKRDKVKKKHPDEVAWKQKAEGDPLFQTLLSEYLESRGKNEYLKERFVRFIKKYAPIEEWEKYIQHPMQDMADSIKEANPSHNLEHLTRKSFFEKYPEDLTAEEIDSILADAYAHRSCFVHRGEQPPHTDPNSSFNRFFQEVREYDGYNIKEAVLPNYELILGLAKNSISNWLSEKFRQALQPKNP